MLDERGMRTHHLRERTHEPLDDRRLETTEAGVLHELGERIDAPREHRERGLRRLHVERERQRHVRRARVVAPQQPEARVGLRGDALECLARVVLVLDREHRGQRAVRQPQALGDERGQERPELLVRSHHRGHAPGVTPRDPLDEGKRVEGEEACVVRETKEVEALEAELVAPVPGGIARGGTVPLVREQHQDAIAHASASAQMVCAQSKAYFASSSFIAGERPPAPGTAFMVRSRWSYLCTEATCTASLSETKL